MTNNAHAHWGKMAVLLAEIAVVTSSITASCFCMILYCLLPSHPVPKQGELAIWWQVDIQENLNDFIPFVWNVVEIVGYFP